MSNAILITGSNGQLGTVLRTSLQQKYGKDKVIASDLRPPPNYDGIFETLDATNEEDLAAIIKKYGVREIYHLAAILSANGEKNPLASWNVNMMAFLNVLETSRLNGVEKIFYPSSIAVFGESAALESTPNDTFLDPLTAYGISKSAGEMWANYYFHKYDLDVRSLRYPGVIGYQSIPGGGTTDYAVEIYHSAVKEEAFNCFLKEDETLPMIFMEDAIRATIELMEVPKEKIKIRTSYNLAGASFSPAEVAASIKEIYPKFEIIYAPDHRQEIAAKWPNSIDDSAARNDWGWQAEYDLKKMTATMIEKLRR
ncbi:NAD-dependent epimerase/dehydratase family protein [Lewinella cohaerens]|uniref:NAD-dependent epimerase/dehydratase family protein n=1 Tax=Lewinella cohaerens TaxID=70995 RepID=UPI0003703CFA|nr:NAD-dependent epimerase/dehydratase family protein [Lewinella cohaerens]